MKPQALRQDAASERADGPFEEMDDVLSRRSELDGPRQSPSLKGNPRPTVLTH